MYNANKALNLMAKKHRLWRERHALVDQLGDYFFNPDKFNELCERCDALTIQINALHNEIQAIQKEEM